ncbi:MAG TPA: PIN domain-containing protein [Gammaproteobacteria bacterium]|nr:PIN domain-containing protein [Gammaproteobacteria bacterium]
MVVDTMVFAYALLGVEEFGEEAMAVLETLDDIIVPDSMRAELTNVLWQWVQHGGVERATAHAILFDADALITGTIACQRLWARALDLSLGHNHPAYDTLFVAAAELSGTRLISFDDRLKKRFPKQVLNARELMKGWD